MEKDKRRKKGDSTEEDKGGESYINVLSMHFRGQIMIVYLLLPSLTRGCEGSLGELCEKLLERRLELVCCNTGPT